MSMDTFAGICEVLGTGADELLWGTLPPKDFGSPDMREQSGMQNDDSYIMYTKIMKSVADIISGT